MTEEYDGEKNKNKSESAIIVGVLLSGDDPHDLADDLDELESLLKTLGIETIERKI